MESQNPSAENPENFNDLKIEKPAKKAAGVKGVTQSLKHVQKYMNAAEALAITNKLNQKDGIDCPGCAWPDPDDERSKLGEYCENGVKAIAEEATKKLLTADFFEKNSIQEISNWSDFEIGKTGRLAEPMFLDENATHYKPITWEDAFAIIANELNNLKTPDEAIFYTSGRTSNEAAFLYQLFVREFGTNNLPDCSNMCHESSGKGLSQTVGIGKGSVTLKDIYKADVVIVMGQNPGTNHPRMLSALEKCKRNGGKIITVNPLKEAGLLNFVDPQNPFKVIAGGTNLTDVYLQIKPNADVALLKAIMKMLLEEEAKNPGTVLDKNFIEAKTNGFEALKNDLENYDLLDLVKQTSLKFEQIEQAVNLLKTKSKIVICWAMGITQHENGVDNVREIVNLLLMKGAIGKEGAGTCPVRGHSNVQGDRTMGIWEAPPQKFLDKIEEVCNFKPPQKHGFAVVDAIEAMKNGKAKVFFAMGGNFLSATPDTNVTAEALRNCALTVQVSTKLNRSHLITGKRALILPCLGRTNIDIQKSGKQFVTVENSMGIVHSSKGVLKPPSNNLKSEPKIVAELAKATLGEKSKMDWDFLTDNYDNTRDLIAKIISGFENYNERVKQPEGFYLPNCAREGKFNTKSGKAEFTINKCSAIELAEDEFLMITNRSHDQFNTTIYGLDDRYRGIFNERRIVMVNEKDMQKHNLQQLQIVNLVSNYNGLRRVAKNFKVVKYNIPQTCVATYFPEANVLVPLELQARGSKTPASKSVKIRIEKL